MTAKTTAPFALLAVLAATSAAPATEIGTIALAGDGVTGTPPAGSDRPLVTGTRVVLDERVRTPGTASAEVLFLDQTTLALGPDTDITLDRFVYDPDAGAGDMALSLTKGALRFIGGAVSDGRPAQITTPTATIGIRGSSALIRTDDRGTRAIFVAGDQMCISTTGGSFCTSEFGGILTEAGYQGRADPDELAEFAGSVEGDPPPPAPDAPLSQTDLGPIDLSQQVPPDAPPLSTRGTPLAQPETLLPPVDSPAAPPALIDPDPPAPPPCIPPAPGLPCR